MHIYIKYTYSYLYILISNLSNFIIVLINILCINLNIFSNHILSIKYPNNLEVTQ